MAVKFGLEVIQDHWKWHQSIDPWIRRPCCWGSRWNIAIRFGKKKLERCGGYPTVKNI